MEKTSLAGKKATRLPHGIKWKHWWYGIFPPAELVIDKIILELSASDPKNEETTHELLKDFLKKYCK